MTNQEIYRAALGLLAEPGDPSDYADRAPYIIANFISENLQLDKNYRTFRGEDAPVVTQTVCVNMDGEFPLSPRFAPAAEFYLASMLIDDEDTDRADTFFDRYCTSLSTIISEIPALREKIIATFGVE